MIEIINNDDLVYAVTPEISVSILDGGHAFKRRAIKKHLKTGETEQIEWLGLKIIETKDGMEKDETGTVSFSASHRLNEKKHYLNERSFFSRENGLWRYVNGETQLTTTAVNPKKVGRNDPCPCKSGLKYKKCCGKV